MKWSATALLCSILVACGTGDQVTLPRAAVVNGNLEVIGDRLDAFLGNDDSGLAAKESLKPFRENLEEISRDYQRSSRNRMNNEVIPPLEVQLDNQSRPRRNTVDRDFSPDYLRRLNVLAQFALIKMDSCYDAFKRDSNITDAKKAFGAGFYALQTTSFKDQIQKKMTEIYDGIAAYYAQKGLPK